MEYLQNVKPIFSSIRMFPSEYAGGGTCKSCCLYGSKVALSKYKNTNKMEKRMLHAKTTSLNIFSELNAQELLFKTYMRCVGNGKNFKIDTFSFPFLSIRFPDNGLLLFNQNLICCFFKKLVKSTFF